MKIRPIALVTWVCALSTLNVRAGTLVTTTVNGASRSPWDTIAADLFCTNIACLLGGRTHLAISADQGPERLCRTLTFAERAAYQYAIEEVYWRHRIWPKENPTAKPLLDAIVSQRQIEQKVEEYPRVGGSFVSGGYNAPVCGASQPPFTGMPAWGGNSNGYIDTVVNLGPSLTGQTVTFRFRMISDEAVAAPGVHIDNLVFTGATCP
jgi:hypothetical protein